MEATGGIEDHRKIVLHVVESFATGVATAVRDYVRNTPECEHHLLYGLRQESGALTPGWTGEFSTCTRLPASHVLSIVLTRQLVHRLRPDVVHSHSSYGGAYARLAVRRSAGLRQIYTPHAWSFDREDRNMAVRLGFWIVEGILAMNTDLIAGCSRAEALEAAWGPFRPAATYLPNITASPERSSRAGGVRGQLVVAGAGRLSFHKDPQFFLECIQEIRNGGHRVDAVWIGGGDDDLTEKLVSADIDVTGWLSHEEALTRLEQADVYLHTARWEGFPIMVLEALAAGVPVVVRRIAAFAHSGLPSVVDTPDDMARLWPVLSDASARVRICELSRDVLWENIAEVQRLRLLEAYDIDPRPAG